MTSLSNYSNKVKETFLNPKNFGEIKNSDAKSRVGNAKCGDIMEMYLKIDKKTKKIKEIKFQTFGCAAAIASTSMLTEIAKGKTLNQAKKLSMKEIIKELKGLPAIKMHCSMMAIQALKKAIEEYEKKDKKF